MSGNSYPKVSEKVYSTFLFDGGGGFAGCPQDCYACGKVNDEKV